MFYILKVFKVATFVKILYFNGVIKVIIINLECYKILF